MKRTDRLVSPFHLFHPQELSLAYLEHARMWEGKVPSLYGFAIQADPFLIE